MTKPNNPEDDEVLHDLPPRCTEEKYAKAIDEDWKSQRDDVRFGRHSW
jgi:hypothetical protein